MAKRLSMILLMGLSYLGYAQVVVSPTAPGQALPSSRVIFITPPAAPDPNAIAAAQQAEQKRNQELMALLSAIGGMGGGGSASSSSFGAGDGGGGEAVGGSNPSAGQTGGEYGVGAGVRPAGSTDLNSPYKIVPVFKKYFDSCTKQAGLGDCKFVNMGIMGDAAHRARRSCHNSGEAIDIGPLTCSSGKIVRPGDAGFYDFAKCMAHNTNDELQTIYMKGEPPNMITKADHNNHVHIQLKNCAMTYGGGSK